MQQRQETPRLGAFQASLGRVSQPRADRALQSVLCLSILLNLLFALQIHRLRTEPIRPDNNIEGQKIASFTATALDGRSVALNFAGSQKPTVVYYFRPDCHWCMRNLANILTLAHQKSDQYKFVGISPRDSSLTKYVGDHQIGFPVYTVPSPGPVNALKLLGGTPQTLVIGTNGTILRSWVGAYTGQNEASIDDFFHIRLPGLLSETGR
jgi:peroxiredoxin